MNTPLPPWIERLLGLKPAPGEGTAWSLHYAWPWPPWVTFVLAVCAAAVVVTVYLRENPRCPRWLRLSLAGLRLGLVALVAVMLAQVVLSLERTGLPYVVVLVDDSLSMTIEDHYAEPQRSAVQQRLAQAGFDRPSRWNLVRSLLTENDAALLSGLQERYKVRLVYLTGMRPGAGATPRQMADELRRREPSGEATRLGGTVRAVLDQLRGTAPAAVVILSDGVNTDGPSLAEAAQYARRKDVPLFTIGLGDDTPLREVKLADLLADDVVFVDDLVNFEAQLSGSGCAGLPVEVVLRQAGSTAVLARSRAVIGPGGRSQPVTLSYRPRQQGQFRFLMEVQPPEGLPKTPNGRQEKVVRVRKEKVRVLLAWAAPSYEFRYLRNMLGRDGSIELHTVLQEADLEYSRQDSAALPGFPLRRDELFQYDVILLGDVNPAALNASTLQNLADFVDQPGKGGALVCIAGPKYMPLAYRDTPLARLLPIDLATARSVDSGRSAAEGFFAEPTEFGRSRPPLQLADTPAENASLWSHLPALYWILAANPRPGAQVLAEAAGRAAPDPPPILGAPPGAARRRPPLILMQYVGAGKVLFHATDETWRWRWRRGDALFARYWVQMLRYLSRSKLADGGRRPVLSTDRREYRRGEPVQLRVRFADERQAPAAEGGVTVVVEHRGHQSQRLVLERSAAGRGVFEALLAAPAVGSYHAWMAAPATAGRPPATDFEVAVPPGEFERTRMDAAELRQAAQDTKGAYYTFFDAQRLLDDLPEGHQVPIETLPPVPLWNRWPLVLLFLLLLVTEWILRKAAGMV
jgi:hypothetical protein